MGEWWEVINNRWIVAPQAEHPFFLRLRNRHPELSFRLTTKAQLLADYYGTLQEGFLYHLMERHGFSLPLAEVYAEELKHLHRNRAIDHEKVAFLEHLYDELEHEGYLQKDPYFARFLAHQRVMTFRYLTDDPELSDLARDSHCVFDVLRRPAKEDLANVLFFDSIDDEIDEVMHHICRLKEQGVSLNHIFIYVIDEGYYYPLHRIARDYQLPLQGFPASSLYATIDAQKLIAYFEEHGSFQNYQGDAPSENELLIAIKNKIAKWPQSWDFNTQKIVLRRELSMMKMPNIHYEEAVTLTKRTAFLEDEYVFVLGFEQGSYPTIRRDDGFLSDAIRQKIHLMTTKDINRETEQAIWGLLSENAQCYVSYKRKSLAGVHHPSMLIDKWHLRVEPSPDHEILYSRLRAEKKIASLLDYRDKYNVALPALSSYEKACPIDYRSYHSRFTYTKHVHSGLFVHSYSSLKLYAQCPYHYYLERLLKIDPFSDNFYTLFGQLAHQVLQANPSDDDFEATFAALKAPLAFAPKEEMWANNMKEELRGLLAWNRHHLTQMKDPILYLERSFTRMLTPVSKLVGTIDKIVMTDNQYLSLIDYKTGKDVFKAALLPYGYSLQLPLYSLLLEEDPDFSSKTLVGAYIQSVLPSIALYARESSPRHQDDGFRLRGMTINDLSGLASFDPTYHDSQFIRGLKMKQDGDFTAHAKVIDASTWKQYQQQTLDVILQMDEAIRQGSFPIAPKMIDNESACHFCPYQDVCFRDDSSLIKIKTKEEAEDATMD